MLDKSTPDSLSLDPSVRSIMVQFILSERELVSGWLWREQAPKDGRALPGKEVVLPHLGVGMLAFVRELADADFTLADAYVNDRHDGQLVARFIFSSEPVRDASQRASLDEHAWPTLVRLCKGAMWQMHAYRNPLPDGGDGFSVNCIRRVHYASQGGSPATILRVLERQLVLEPTSE